jgi:hypothetical protein
MIGMTEGLRHARRHGPNTTGSVNDRSPKGGASGMLKPCIAAKENLLGRIGVLNIAGRSVVTVSESCADAVLRHRVPAAGPAKASWISKPRVPPTMSVNNKRVFYVKYLAHPIYAEILKARADVRLDRLETNRRFGARRSKSAST